MDAVRSREQAVVGASPHDVVLRYNKLRVFHYHQARRRYATPILLVPALISPSYILDLYPGGSFVEFLVERGWDVYLIDWGYPGDEDAGIGLEDLLGEYLPRAIARVREVARSRALTLFGYCMGGTLVTIYAALNGWAKPNNLIALAAPIDFAQGGVLRTWCSREHCDIDRIVDTFGNVPAPLIEAVFRTIKPTTSLAAALAYTKAGGEQAFDAAFFAMDRWVHEFFPFPGRAACQWIKWFYQENRLVEGRLELLGRSAALAAITAPVLAIAASTDHIAPPGAVEALLEHVGSTDKRLLALAGGHVGTVAGRSARNTLWPSVEAWLREHTQRRGDE